jgi:hypothetical protein
MVIMDRGEGIWRWNVNPTWNHFSSMCQEGFLAEHASNSFEKYHHLSSCLYFGIGAIEAFLNEQMRLKLSKGEDERQILKKLRSTGLADKVNTWPAELCDTEVDISPEVQQILEDYNELRGEVTHPKRRDHSVFAELDEARPGDLVRAVSYYQVAIYERRKNSFPYWLLGWNYVGMNNDPTFPCLLNNQQFRHSLCCLGYKVPAWEYHQANAWEQENMTTRKGFNDLKALLDSNTLEIEPREPRFPIRPRLCKRWWDKELIRT